MAEPRAPVNNKSLLKPVDATNLDILQVQSLIISAEAQIDSVVAAAHTAKSYLAEAKRALGKMLEPSEKT